MNDTTGAQKTGAQSAVITAAILVIGDEILSGRTKDKNIGYIAEYLTALGIELKEVRVVGDEEAEIVAAVNALRKYDTPTARARVVKILVSRIGSSRDVDLATQTEALRAIMLMNPERADVLRIAAAIVKDTLHRDLYGEVIPLFRKGKASLADIGPALDAIFERSAQLDNDLQTRIDTLRAELSAQAVPPTED